MVGTGCLRICSWDRHDHINHLNMIQLTIQLQNFKNLSGISQNSTLAFQNPSAGGWSQSHCSLDERKGSYNVARIEQKFIFLLRQENHCHLTKQNEGHHITSVQHLITSHEQDKNSTTNTVHCIHFSQRDENKYGLLIKVVALGTKDLLQIFFICHACSIVPP